VQAHILIVEDDADILSSLAEALREEGYMVETAANGFQALSRLEARVPDLIFLDLMMPVMDGWKFIDAVHQRFPAMDAPIVLLSAVHELAAEAHRLGVARCLAKPFELEDVVRIAHELCDRPVDRRGRTLDSGNRAE
jgi:CheY-like chemotaxis protein